MGKKNKGLADQGDGEFILNESGTSVNTDSTEKEDTDPLKKTNNQEEPFIPPVADPQKDITD
jgi:hypothetical protein